MTGPDSRLDLDQPDLAAEFLRALSVIRRKAGSGELSGEFLAAVIRLDLLTPVQACAWAADMPEDWQRADAWRALADAGYLSPELAQEAFTQALELFSGDARTLALRSLLPHLPEKERHRALNRALERPMALKRALQAAKKLPKAASLKAQAELLCHVPPNAVQRQARALAAQAARQAVQSPVSKPELLAQALLLAFPFLPALEQETYAALIEKQLLPEMEHASDQVDTLCRLSTLCDPALADDWMDKAWHVLQGVNFPLDYILAVLALAPYLPPGLRSSARCQQMLRQALTCCREPIQEEHRGGLLGELGEFLSGELLQRALQKADRLSDLEFKAEAWSGLVFRLEGESQQALLQRLLQALPDVKFSPRRLRMLARVLPLLEREQQRALAEQELKALAPSAANENDQGAFNGLVHELMPRLLPHMSATDREACVSWLRCHALENPAAQPWPPFVEYLSALERAEIIAAIIRKEQEHPYPLGQICLAAPYFTLEELAAAQQAFRGRQNSGRRLWEADQPSLEQELQTVLDWRQALAQGRDLPALAPARLEQAAQFLAFFPSLERQLALDWLWRSAEERLEWQPRLKLWLKLLAWAAPGAQAGLAQQVFERIGSQSLQPRAQGLKLVLCELWPAPSRLSPTTPSPALSLRETLAQIAEGGKKDAPPTRALWSALVAAAGEVRQWLESEQQQAQKDQVKPYPLMKMQQEWVRIQAGLLDFFEPPGQQALIENMLELGFSNAIGREQLELFQQVLERYPAEKRSALVQQRLAELGKLDEPFQVCNTLMLLAPHIPAEQIGTAVQLAQKIGIGAEYDDEQRYAEERCLAMIALSAFVDGELQGSCMQAAFAGLTGMVEPSGAVGLKAVQEARIGQALQRVFPALWRSQPGLTRQLVLRSLHAAAAQGSRAFSGKRALFLDLFCAMQTPQGYARLAGQLTQGLMAMYPAPRA